MEREKEIKCLQDPHLTQLSNDGLLATQLFFFYVRGLFSSDSRGTPSHIAGFLFAHVWAHGCQITFIGPVQINVDNPHWINQRVVHLIDGWIGGISNTYSGELVMDSRVHETGFETTISITRMG